MNLDNALNSFKDTFLKVAEPQQKHVMRQAITVNPTENVINGARALYGAGEGAYHFINSVLHPASTDPVMAAGIPPSSQVGQSRITEQPTTTPQPNADGITHLSTSVVTPTPAPGEDAYVSDMSKEIPGRDAQYWHDLYKKSVTSKDFSGNYYKGAKEETKGQGVLGATSIDPSLLPTYNNDQELAKASPYVGAISQSAKTYGIAPEILAAALWRESAGFNPKYVNGRHEDGTGRGIAGIDAVQRADVPDDVAYNPQKAIDWMAKTLKTYQDQEGGNMYNALRRYNGGPNYADTHPGFNGEPVDTLTKKHADYIEANAKNLAKLFKS